MRKISMENDDLISEMINSIPMNRWKEKSAEVVDGG
jgi:hypothetical protein